MRNKVIIAVILLAAIVGVGIYIYSRSSKTETPQYGLLKPKPGEEVVIPQQSQNSYGPNPAQPQPQIPPVKTPAQQSASAANATSEPPKGSAAAPKGKVLGEQTKAAQPKPAPKKISSAASSASQTGFSTYRIPELSFEISVPSSWLPKSEVRGGQNVIAFFSSSGKRLGEIAVLSDAQESFSALETEIAVKTQNFSETSFAGQPAFIYVDPDFGQTIGFVYKGSVYYLRGQVTNAAQLSHFHLL